MRFSGPRMIFSHPYMAISHLIETKKEKTLFLMQALYLCWIDDEYSELEREEIGRIGNELGVDLSELAEIETWVRQGIEWLGAGAALLGLE